MFIKYSSYNVKPNVKQQTQLHSTQNKQILQPIPDQYTFTDFFIRNTNQPYQTTHKLVHNQQKINQSTTKKNNFFINQQPAQPIHQTVLSLPIKNTLDIKYITQKFNSKTNSPLRSLLRKQHSQKFKSKKQHIIERKLEPFLSLKGSARYTKHKNNSLQGKSQSISRQLVEKGKPFQFSVNFAQNNNKIIDEKDKQKKQKSFLGAYKIKSLILQRNPKQQILDRTKRYQRKQIDKKPFTTYSQVQSGRAQSEQPYEKYETFQKIDMDESRLTTEQKSERKSCRMQKTSSYREKQNIRFSSPRQNKKINLKNIQVKEISISPFCDKFGSNNKQVPLEPWVKSTYEQDIFSENIQQAEIEFQPFQNTLENLPTPLTSINTGHRTTRSSYRKIYSTKQSAKINRATIRSQK